MSRWTKRFSLFAIFPEVIAVTCDSKHRIYLTYTYTHMMLRYIPEISWNQRRFRVFGKPVDRSLYLRIFNFVILGQYKRFQYVSFDLKQVLSLAMLRTVRFENRTHNWKHSNQGKRMSYRIFLPVTNFSLKNSILNTKYAYYLFYELIIQANQLLNQTSAIVVRGNIATKKNRMGGTSRGQFFNFKYRHILLWSILIVIYWISSYIYIWIINCT